MFRIVLCGVTVGLVLTQSVRHAFAEDESAKAIQVARRFLEAMKAKDLDGIMNACAVPWFDPFENRLFKDRAALSEYWKERLRESDTARIRIGKMEATRYGEFRKWETIEGDPEFNKSAQKVHEAILEELDKVLDASGWIVSNDRATDFESRSILVRNRAGVCEVVCGPCGCGYLQFQNRIPPNARLILERATFIELLSLDPKLPDKEPLDGFHGRTILGKTHIAADSDRRKLVVALKESVAEAGCMFAGCFMPRHGIRAVHEGQTAEFVICFECHRMTVFVGEKTDEDSSAQLTHLGEPTFDEILRAAGVPLAEKKK